ncbi:hypothetical protein Pme01_50820 [Planosporangium mesophilum]|uniref:Uncharacterized protein n=1 Tax=Planosporangium mesophilum TaxID=689768 RepID=A0A8J3TQG4_9ACTN|nr:hypothetical protein Pme01_50820 [Planosporangium mesophilum]
MVRLTMILKGSTSSGRILRDHVEIEPDLLLGVRRAVIGLSRRIGTAFWSGPPLRFPEAMAEREIRVDPRLR